MAGLRPLPGGEPRGGLGTASSHRRQGLSLQPPGVRTTEPGSQAAARGPTTGSRPTDVSLASVWGDLFTPCPHCWPSTATKREQTGVGRCWGADPGGTRQPPLWHGRGAQGAAAVIGAAVCQPAWWGPAS